MAQVPIVNQNQVGVSRTPQEYNKVSADPKAFGDFGWTDVAQKQLKEAEKILQDREDEMLTAQAFEKNNELDDLYTNLLYHPETGFRAKQGKDAAYQAQSAIDNYTKESQKIIDGVGNIRVKNKLNEVQARKERSFAQAAFAHDIEQKRIYHNDLMQSTIKTQTDNGILGRSNPEAIASSIQNIRTAIGTYSGETDPELLKAMQDNAVSSLHLNIINSMLENNELGTKAYFEAHKNEISPTTKGYDGIVRAISVNDIKGRAMLESDKLIASGLSIDKQLEAVRKIKDPELRDEVQSRLEHNYSIQERIAADAKQKREERAWDLLERNPSINNIPSDVDAQTRISMKNYLKSITEDGEVKTNQQVWYGLYNLAVENPDEFKKINLLQYKGYLSDSDFQEIAKLKSKAGTAEYSQIITPYQEVKNVATSLGLVKKTDFQESSVLQYTVQTALQAEEQAKGRKLTAPERTEFIKSFGYKANHPGKDYENTFDIYQKGMGNNPDFIRETINDFKYFEKVHNRMPDAKERNDIAYRRAVSVINKQNTNTIQNIKQKKGETIELTNYADNYVPRIANQLGMNLTVTSRYRPNDQGMHGKGKAIDISMSEHKQTDRLKFVANELLNPAVVKIGTSDPYILQEFRKSKIGDRKINDLREYDKKHGTDHTNHVHVTLQTSGNQVQTENTVRMQAPNGKIYYVPESRVAEYKKAGGTLL